MKYRFKIILISVILYSSCKPQKIFYLTLPDNHPQKLFLYTDYSEYKPLKTDKKGNFYLTVDTSKIATSTPYKKIFYAKLYYSINNSEFKSIRELPYPYDIYRVGAGYVDTNNIEIINCIEYYFRIK
jgi:hypothetical protein